MKKTTTLLLYTLALSACNLGTPTSNDVQSANNSTKQFSLALVAIGCKTISANGGSCNLAITHSAAASKYLNQAIVISLPNLYKISANNCKSTQAKSSSCSVTISSNA